MSDKVEQGSANDDRLFKNMDEQERIYAPQQIPGALQPAEEGDAAGAGSERIAGAEGDQRTTPVIPVRPEIGITQPVPTPVVPRDDQLNDTNR